MDPITIALIALGALAIARTPGGSSPRADVIDRNLEARRIADRATFISNRFDTMPGLDTFLLAVAYTESRFNPSAQNGTGSNAARGWFQMRPQSAFRPNNGLEHLRHNPDLLKNRNWAVVTATDYAAQAAEKAIKQGWQPNWAAVRRYWAYPSLLDDWHNEKSRSKTNKRNFEKALDKIGVPRSFMMQPVRLGGYPNAIVVAKSFGLM